jgi:uncharacterized membrane protein
MSVAAPMAVAVAVNSALILSMVSPPKETLLIVGLLREKLWYYPLSMLVFGAFVAYQLFRFQVTHSLWLMAMTILDIVVIAMTWHEYRFGYKQI